MLTDLIAANSTEAEAIVKAVGLEARWPILPVKSVDQIKLSSLALLRKATAIPS